MKKLKRNPVFEMAVYLLIAGLAGDILYLYYAGSWIEPRKVIEVSELIMLWAFVAGGIILAVVKLLDMKKERQRRKAKRELGE